MKNKDEQPVKVNLDLLPTLDPKDVKHELSKLEKVLLQQHTMLRYFIRFMHQKHVIDWNYLKAFEDSNENLITTYYDFCYTLFETSLTDGYWTFDDRTPYDPFGRLNF